MIYDELEHAQLYEGVDPAIGAALQFLQQCDLAALQEGRAELPQGRGFYSVSSYETKDREDARFETHERYVDIQLLIEGKEIISCAPRDSVQLITPYDPEGDITFYAGSGCDISLKAGQFIIIYPHEAHQPCVAAGRRSTVRKIVCKIPVVQYGE